MHSTVFISYSQKDEEEKNKLLSHLGVLQNAGLIDPWSDDRIGAGADWEQEISKAITKAKVAILLITVNYLNSGFILKREVPELLERRDKESIHIFPIIAKACAWNRVAWLVKMSIRPSNHKPVWGDHGSHVDEDLARIAEEIAEIIGTTAIRRQGYRNDNLEGSIIIDLLKGGLDKDLSLPKSMEESYGTAGERMVNDPEGVIAICKMALTALDGADSSVNAIAVNKQSLLEESWEDDDYLDIPKYSRGKFNLLLASIYLNKDKDLKLAQKYYNESQKEFRGGGWLQLWSLARLGLAFVHRKLNNRKEAMEVWEKAHELASQEGIPKQIDTSDLREEIQEEKDRIEQLGDKTSPTKPTEPISKRVFDVSIGARIVAEKAVTDLNFLGKRDYEIYEQRAAKDPKFDVDIEKFADKLGLIIDEISYVLEIPNSVETKDGLEAGDRLLIAQKTDPDELNSKRVVVLVVEDNEKREKQLVTLKTFFNAARDHYYLQAESKDAGSFIVSRYGSSEETIKNYYEKYKRGGLIDHKIAFDIRITGEVKGIIRQGAILEIVANNNEDENDLSHSEPIIWKIPVVGKIAAGVGPISPDNVREYLYLDDSVRKDANFALIVEGDSMNDYDILSGDIVLIKQQEHVENGEIAALVVKTPTVSLEVIKKYFHEEREGREHWFLKSGNNLSEDLVLIPSGIDVEAVKRPYIKGEQSSMIQFYEDSEVSIAGKFVGKISKVQS